MKCWNCNYDDRAGGQHPHAFGEPCPMPAHYPGSSVNLQCECAAPAPTTKCYYCEKNSHAHAWGGPCRIPTTVGACGCTWGPSDEQRKAWVPDVWIYDIHGDTIACANCGEYVMIRSNKLVHVNEATENMHDVVVNS